MKWLLLNPELLQWGMSAALLAGGYALRHLNVLRHKTPPPEPPPAPAPAPVVQPASPLDDLLKRRPLLKMFLDRVDDELGDVLTAFAKKLLVKQ